MKTVFRRFGALLWALTLALPASATVLIFENTSGFNLGAIFPQAYGDRVSASSQGGFVYSLTGGATPNVVVDYQGFAGWPTGYGDLRNVIYPSGFGPFQIRLAADASYEVSLQSLDLGSWFNTNRVIRSLEVRDAAGTALYVANDLLVVGTGPTHTSIVFSPPIQSRVLTIRVDSSNLGVQAGNVCVDNLRFSQVSVPVYVDIALYPGLSVYGTIGKSYRVDYATRMPPTEWAPLATVLLTNNPTRFIDYEAPSTTARYYRAVELP